MEPVPPPERRGPTLSVAEIVFFVAAVVIVGTLVAILNGLSPADRTLVDNDGYMRFLRIEQLAATGNWFDPVSHRSNYPYGETLHWTRPLDVYVLGLSLILLPFLGEEALYWAAFINGPLLLVAVGLIGVWAFGSFMRPGIRPIFAFAQLGLPLIIAYLGFGRVDHHGLILLGFVWTVGLLLRGLHQPTDRAAGLLGFSLGVGMWVSTEFLMPWVATAGTIGVLIAFRDRTDLCRFGTFTFAVAAVTTGAATVIERGGTITGVEFDRISIVHIVIALLTCMVFALLAVLLRRGFGPFGRWLSVVGGALIGGASLIGLFPQLTGGPFVAVDPVVRERWLDNVTELLPLSLDEGPGLIVFRIAPIMFGLVALAVISLRSEDSAKNSEALAVLGGWLIAYSVLTITQFRWTLFSHYLALVIVMIALGPVFERIGEWRSAVVIRPLLLASLLVFPLVGGGIESESTGADRNCSLDDIYPFLREVEPSTILANQDIGPNLLYHTQHTVIATPYHRNTDGLRYLFDLMAEKDLSVVRSRLVERSVGLVLICPGPQELTHPPDPEGTFYEALVEGPLPGFVEPLEVDVRTEYLLFRVEA